MTIKFYKTNDPYGFLNNFKKAPIYIYDRWWKNVEAAYQSQKFDDPQMVEKIWLARTPREARDLGQTDKLPPCWTTSKYYVMFECVLAKFLQHSDLREQLIATGDEELVEDSPVDSYWGCGPDGKGQNMLGKILMRVREIVKGIKIYDTETKTIQT